MYYMYYELTQLEGTQLSSVYSLWQVATRYLYEVVKSVLIITSSQRSENTDSILADPKTISSMSEICEKNNCINLYSFKFILKSTWM